MKRRSRADKKRGKFESALDDHLNAYTLNERKESREIIVEARSEAQKRYIVSIKQNRLTFGVGAAGTGKTFVCTALAAQALKSGEINKLVLTRPAVEAGESLGFLPGTEQEKFDPYMNPFRDVLHDVLGRGFTDYAIKVGKIQSIPLAYMRGRTFSDAWVILDEAQNTSPTQMKMFLTRIGSGSKMIVNGDMDQTDIKGQNGLRDAVNRFDASNKIGVVEFEIDDVVRDPLVREILIAYR